MDFIIKKYPINERNNKKKIRYCIKDNLVDFYYRYLFVARNKELRREPAFFFENFVKDDFINQFIPHKFEDISKEFLFRMNLQGKITPVFFDIGECYYDNQKEKINRQFDVVTEDKNGFISYECKYKNTPIDNGDINEEIFQTSNLPNIKFYKLGFISKSGFTDNIEIEKYNTFSLADFYK